MYINLRTRSLHHGAVVVELSGNAATDRKVCAKAFPKGIAEPFLINYQIWLAKKPAPAPTASESDLKAFAELVRTHDLTYTFSDSGAVWKNGEKQRDAILKMADTLPIEDVTRIWNAEVDRKISKDGQPSIFYWKVAR